MNKIIDWFKGPIDLIKMSMVTCVFFVIGTISYKFNPCIELVYINIFFGSVSLVCVYVWAGKQIFTKYKNKNDA